MNNEPSVTANNSGNISVTGYNTSRRAALPDAPPAAISPRAITQPVKRTAQTNKIGALATLRKSPFGLTRVTTAMTATAYSVRNGQPMSAVEREISAPVNSAAKMMLMPDPVGNPTKVADGEGEFRLETCDTPDEFTRRPPRQRGGHAWTRV